MSWCCIIRNIICSDLGLPLAHCYSCPCLLLAARSPPHPARSSPASYPPGSRRPSAKVLFEPPTAKIHTEAWPCSQNALLPCIRDCLRKLTHFRIAHSVLREVTSETRPRTTLEARSFDGLMIAASQRRGHSALLLCRRRAPLTFKTPSPLRTDRSLSALSASRVSRAVLRGFRTATEGAEAEICSASCWRGAASSAGHAVPRSGRAVTQPGSEAARKGSSQAVKPPSSWLGHLSNSVGLSSIVPATLGPQLHSTVLRPR